MHLRDSLILFFFHIFAQTLIMKLSIYQREFDQEHGADNNMPQERIKTQLIHIFFH